MILLLSVLFNTDDIIKIGLIQNQYFKTALKKIRHRGAAWFFRL